MTKDKDTAIRTTPQTDVMNARDTEFSPRLYKSFNLQTSDSISGIADRPGVSCDNQSYSDHLNVSSIPTQPFIKCCFVFYVEVHTLIDTGSMTTFISNKIHNIIDFDSTLIDTTVEERCVSQIVVAPII